MGSAWWPASKPTGSGLKKYTMKIAVEYQRSLLSKSSYCDNKIMRWWVERGIFDNNREQNLRCWSCKCHHVNARQKRETDVQLLVTVSCRENVTKAIHEKNLAIRNPLPLSTVIL